MTPPGKTRTSLRMLAAPLTLIFGAGMPGAADAAPTPTVLAPGATTPDALPMSALVKAVGPSNRIDGLTVEELDDGTTVLHVMGSAKPTFNVYRLGDPDRLVVDLAAAERGKVVPHVPLDTWACGRVSVSPVSERNADLVRVVIELKREVSYVVVPKGGELIITVTPRQIAPDAYFARKDAGARQEALVAKEAAVAAAERDAKKLGEQTKVLNTQARQRAEAAKRQAKDADARAKRARTAERTALAAEKRALQSETTAGLALAEAKGQRFKARRVLKQAQAEREQAEQARAAAQAERKQAETARNAANAKLATARAELAAEKAKLIAARGRAEQAEAQATVAKGRAEAAEREALSIKGVAEREKLAAQRQQRAAQAAQMRADKAERAAKAAQAASQTQLAAARAALARAKAAASRADADAKAKLAKAERAAAKAAEATGSAAAHKLQDAAKVAAEELHRAKRKAAEAEKKAEAKLAAAVKAERDAKAALTTARAEAKVMATKLIADAVNQKRAAEIDSERTRAQAKVAAEQVATQARKQAKAEAAKLLADAGAKRESAVKLQAKAKAALSRAEVAVAEAQKERKAAAAARAQTDAALAVAQTRVKRAKRGDRAKARRAVAAAHQAAAAALSRQKETEAALARLQRDRNDLKTKLAEQKRLAHALDSKIASRKSELSRLELKVKHARIAAGAEVVTDNAKLSAAHKALARAKVTATVLEKEVDRLSRQSEAADLRAASAEAELARLRHAGAAQTKLAAAERVASTAKSDANHAAQAVAQRTKKLAQVEKELTGKRAAVQALKTQHAALQARHDKLANKNANAARELRAAQADLAQLRASLAAERSELRAVSQDVEHARATVEGRLAMVADVEAANKQAQRAKREAEEAKRAAAAERAAALAAKSQAEAAQLAARTEADGLAKAKADAQARATKPKPKPDASRVKDVRFEHDALEQRVVVAVDGPIRFEGSSLTPTIKMLAFDNAALAKKLERSLDATSYAGVIKSVTSFAEGDATKVLVSTVAPSMARVEERPGELVWHFPSPSQGAAADVVSMAGSKVAGYATGPGASAPLAAIPSSRMAAFAPPSATVGVGQTEGRTASRRSRWRGERIDIELQDAPIKDVLLLFSDIGRVNIIAGRGVDGSVTMKLNAVPWDQALDIILRSLQLGSNREGNVIRVATIDDLETERQQAIDRANARIQVKPLETRLVPVSYATVEDMIPKVQSVLSPRGTVTPDSRTNTLIIMDVSDNIALAEQLVGSLDTQTPQVLIEARIVEARTNFTRNLGIQWGFDFTASPGTGNPTGLLFPNSVGIGGGGAGQPADVRGLVLPGAAANPNYAVDLPAPVGTGQGGAVGFSFGSITGNLNTNLRLSAAESTGEVRIISAPKIVTLDNNEAQIETGVQIPISQVSAQGVNTRFVNATLSLRVTPQVTNEGAVLLDVQVQKNEADFINTGARGDPTILTNQARSRLLVNDADTAVIGGIYTRNKAVNFTKIPWLADIPIIGWFFKNKSEADTRSEILIFLTPKIVNRASSIGG